MKFRLSRRITLSLFGVMLEERNVRTGFLDDSGYVRLKRELPEYLRPLFVVGYHVGTRLGELRSLQWGQVDLKYKTITLNPGETKNGEGRTLPIYGEMGAWLTMQRELRDAKFPAVRFRALRRGQSGRRLP